MKGFLLLLFLIIITSRSYAVHKGVYGTDNRHEVVDVTESWVEEAANATAVMVESKNIIEVDDQVSFSGVSYRAKTNLCPEEDFGQQKTIGDCSGFLIAPNLLVTAAHCVMASNSCENNSWVFGYYADEEGKSPVSLSKDNVYRCKKIVAKSWDPFVARYDHAVVELDRSVTQADPLSFRRSGKIDDDADLIAIGNPYGLPTKVISDATIRNNSNPYWFVTNLDAFSGNSGSAVINLETGVVEGLVVRGDRDFAYDKARSCYYTKRYPMETSDPTAYGEHVSRITNIDYLKTLR